MTASDLIVLRKIAGQAAKRQREATEARDVAIAGLRAKGEPSRAIADLVGLSHTAVNKIAQRTDICAECLMPGGRTDRSFRFHLESCPTQQ